MEFLKLEELELNAAGYLISKKSKQPVTHNEFVELQRKAHYAVKLSEAIKDKNFKAVKVDSLDAIAKKVKEDIDSETKFNYVDSAVKPVNTTVEELTKFALDFINYENENEFAEKVNQYMQSFNIIRSIEENGDYFTTGVVKLSKLYTIGEIVKAAKINIEKVV